MIVIVKVMKKNDRCRVLGVAGMPLNSYIMIKEFINNKRMFTYRRQSHLAALARTMAQDGNRP
jgi:hypothetical protein